MNYPLKKPGLDHPWIRHILQSSPVLNSAQTAALLTRAVPST
ncbi:hypothetical protein [Legionella sp. 27cVA30]|nr:hypothetical protein [Legionella sp. 27cVA30]